MRMANRHADRLAAGDAVERVFSQGSESSLVQIPPESSPTATEPDGLGGLPALRAARSFVLPPLLPQGQQQAGTADSSRTAVDVGAGGAAPSSSEKVVALRPSARLPASLDPVPKTSPHRTNSKTVYPVSRERLASLMASGSPPS